MHVREPLRHRDRGVAPQGFPEGATRECYPIAPPGNAPCPDVRDRDLDKREVRRLCLPFCLDRLLNPSVTSLNFPLL